jgi:very-short-patch-repair endonuclease
MTSITSALPLLFLMFFVLIVIAIVAKKLKSKTITALVKAKIPLTKNEQPMFFRLVEAFPDQIVLAQVAFSALVTTKDRATRNTFDRKIADFVICNKAFEVQAIIELDDSSHKGRELQDEKRISPLIQAGYKVLRYKMVPNIETLQKDLVILVK